MQGRNPARPQLPPYHPCGPSQATFQAPFVSDVLSGSDQTPVTSSLHHFTFTGGRVPRVHPNPIALRACKCQCQYLQDIGVHPKV
mmetsp:Transcript_130295/g.225277  ORF Transcript_130295/g.225277 Transcript_130295/m.225277 type:complete len:85 (-) Transcript_130295:84-338(-)